MNSKILPALLLLACIPWLSACGKDEPPQPVPATGVLAEVSAEISKEMENVSREVREAMATENIDIADGDEAPAEITPQGDLLIDGRKVEIDADQRALLLEYRGHIAYMAETGAAIGMQGAGIATDAIGMAVASIFSGTTEDLEAKIEAKAEKIAQQAVTELCGRMPALMRNQQALAASLPEFAPYADITQADIDDCNDGRYSTQ
ncbi:DUF2884 family protein [Lysobacter sp. F60174L2]|uniref:DUF2884 family protein n=1 Tax=Lysobacter sp. F60174L2 TaxID=3459295 RepID=UPI00403DFC62